LSSSLRVLKIENDCNDSNDKHSTPQRLHLSSVLMTVFFMMRTLARELEQDCRICEHLCDLSRHLGELADASCHALREYINITTSQGIYLRSLPTCWPVHIAFFSGWARIGLRARAPAAATTGLPPSALQRYVRVVYRNPPQVPCSCRKFYTYTVKTYCVEGFAATWRRLFVDTIRSLVITSHSVMNMFASSLVRHCAPEPGAAAADSYSNRTCHHVA
jgi:hypothetical protein